MSTAATWGFHFVKDPAAGVDPDPNVVDPVPANLTFEVASMIQRRLALVCEGGTSVTLSVFLFDSMLSKWVLWADALVVTAGNATFVALPSFCIVSLQCTAFVGPPTRVLAGVAAL